MKKYMAFVLVIALCLGLCSMLSFAGEPSSGKDLSEGFFDVSEDANSGITIAGFYKGSDNVLSEVPINPSNEKLGLDGDAAEETHILYQEAEKFVVKVPESKQGKQYLVLLVTGNSLPTD